MIYDKWININQICDFYYRMFLNDFIHERNSLEDIPNLLLNKRLK